MEWALAWCKRHPTGTCVIPRCKSPEQVEVNALAASLDIVKENHPVSLRNNTNLKAYMTGK
jgi:aryl-alcohol dehydrogenase-like predicted oxidoreductase